jgi:hypothetical protein
VGGANRTWDRHFVEDVLETCSTHVRECILVESHWSMQFEAIGRLPACKWKRKIHLMERTAVQILVIWNLLDQMPDCIRGCDYYKKEADQAATRISIRLRNVGSPQSACKGAVFERPLPTAPMVVLDPKGIATNDKDIRTRPSAPTHDCDPGLRAALPRAPCCLAVARLHAASGRNSDLNSVWPRRNKRRRHHDGMRPPTRLHTSCMSDRCHST